MDACLLEHVPACAQHKPRERMMETLLLCIRRETASVTVVFADAKGGVSGGTVASGFGAFDDPNARRVASDPYCLNPAGSWRASAVLIPFARPVVFLRADYSA